MAFNYEITVVDDEVANLDSLRRILESDGAKVHTYADPHEALQFLRSSSSDILLTDFRMHSLSGLDLLEALKSLNPSIEVILVTAYGTVELAVEAMKKGAYDFITKPLQRLQVLQVIHKALDKRKLALENMSLREELTAHLSDGERAVIGRSEKLRSMMGVVNQAARSKANVLIDGESGTGKGIVAEYLHRHSEHREGVFVKINCTAIPENLLEAELFGYEPGAFTGAVRRKKGRVELAEGGTLFLDEIGIAPLTLQTKLLRFLQEGEFERLGSNETLKIQTRVVAATNSDLKLAIQRGEFREDLYYRLNVIHIQVPPLRERQEDVALLAQKFLEDSAKKNGRPLPSLRSDALEALIRYPWPGNIRELQNLMERLVVLNKSGSITRDELPPEIGENQRTRLLQIPLGTTLREIERQVMDETLRCTQGDKRLAAKLLGIHPRTIYRYLESLSGFREEPLPQS